MKAAICRSLNSPLSIEDVELGPPGKDEVRLNVAACSICHSDLSFMRGDWARTRPFCSGMKSPVWSKPRVRMSPD